MCGNVNSFAKKDTFVETFVYLVLVGYPSNSTSLLMYEQRILELAVRKKIDQ